MIQSFRDQGTEDVFNRKDTKRARKTIPQQLWKVALRKLNLVNTATRLQDFKVPPNNKFEALKEDRAGQHAIRINQQYRVCFEWTTAGPENVEITDYHT